MSQSGGASSASGGVSGLVLIETITANNSANITFLTGISATHYNYLLVYDNVGCGIAEDYLQLQYSTNGGVSWKNTNYSSATGEASFDDFGGSPSQSSTTSVVFATGNSGGINAGNLNIYNLTSGNPVTAVGIGVSSQFAVILGGGNYNNGTDVMNAIQITYQSSVIPTGNFHLYGFHQ